MCGIFCCISRHGHAQIAEQTRKLLTQRGPDSLEERKVVLGDTYITFVSSVLSMRGSAVVPQPLFDEASGSVLCWNGEAWKIDDEPVIGNDSNRVLDLLLAATSPPESATQRVLSAFSRIRGPYACVFYDGCAKQLYFGRDCLGRRSLVRTISSNGDLLVASVSDSTNTSWTEVEGDGMYVLSLSDLSKSSGDAFSIDHYPLYYLNNPKPESGGIVSRLTHI
jgi:asparagine synthetase B (glutamine-hydrolysing)